MKTRYREINGCMDGKEIFIIGSGASLKGFDFHKLDNKYTIAINHTIEDYPQAKALLFGDKIFCKTTTFNMEAYQGKIFACEYTKDSSYMNKIRDKSNVYFFDPVRSEPTNSAKQGLYHPCLSGLMALNLALIMRASKIYLLGFDMHFDNGMHYYSADRHPHQVDNSAEKWRKKAEKFQKFKAHARKIINLSPDSIIDDFPKKRLEDVIK